MKLVITARSGQHIMVAPSSDGLSVTTGTYTQDFAGTFTKIVANARRGKERIAINSAVTTTTVLHGGPGRDTLIAGGGTTEIYSGTGRDLLIGGTGQDTLVALGSQRDTLVGGNAVDSFWAADGDKVKDVTPAETAVRAVHWLVAPTIQPEAAVESESAEPAIGMSGLQYKPFAGDPLFAPGGPSPNDISQGQLGDCYFLATLAAVAHADPNQIRQDVVQLADGSYLVRFIDGNQSIYEHVDNQLPTYASGEPAFAQLGQDDSIWVAVMEKAFAMFRDNADSYANLSGGWMNEVYSDLGLSSTDTYPDSASDLISLIQSDLAQGEAVTIATLQVPAGIPIVSDHAYSVDSVPTDDTGAATGLTLRNPWGEAGMGLPANDGYLTVTADQAFAAAYVVTAAPA